MQFRPSALAAAVLLALAWPLRAAPLPPPHPQPTAAAATVVVRGGTAVWEAEAGEGGWERIDEAGTAAIRAVSGKAMRYAVRFDAAGEYFLHLRCHHAGGTKNAAGETLKGESTNDAVVTVGGAPLYGADGTTRPVGMRCHSREFRWWSLPKGPGAHTPGPIRDLPVRTFIPAPGVYEIAVGYRSPGLVIDKLAVTATPAPPPESVVTRDRATGAYVAEIEAVAPVAEWKLETEHSGFSGAGYFAWRGPHVKKQPGTAVLKYPFTAEAAGRYRLSIRARRDRERGEQRAGDQCNDVFVRLDGADPWIKVSHRTPWGQWGTMKHFSYHHGLEDAVFALTPGAHVLEIAARSDNVKIDTLRLDPVSPNP